MLQEVISKKDAIEKGLKRYFTGKPCVHGHIAERLVSDCVCLMCAKIKLKGWVAKNKDRCYEIHKKYYDRNKKRLAKDKREYNKENIELIKEQRKRRLKNKREKQANRPKPNKCEACGKMETENRLGRIAFDHCHETGLFRGWLCARCNMALGFVRDDINLLEKLAKYLKKFRGSNELSCKTIDIGGVLY
jgi:hypothetical protein